MSSVIIFPKITWNATFFNNNAKKNVRKLLININIPVYQCFIHGSLRVILFCKVLSFIVKVGVLQFLAKYSMLYMF